MRSVSLNPAWRHPRQSFQLSHVGKSCGFELDDKAKHKVRKTKFTNIQDLRYDKKNDSDREWSSFKLQGYKQIGPSNSFLKPCEQSTFNRDKL